MAIAQANALPPPSLSWFRFENIPEQLEAIQVVECDTVACQKPVLLANSGACTESECLPLTDSVFNLDCRGETCLVHDLFFDPNAEKKDLIRLLVQTGDRLWVSNFAPTPTTEVYGFSSYWLAQFRGDRLVLVAEPTPFPRDDPIPFLQGLLITLLTEAVILALILQRLKLDRTVWVRTFVSFG